MGAVMKPGQRAKIEEQKLQSLRLWMSGATYRQIADALSIPVASAYKRVQDAVDDMRPHADFDRYRAVQLSELEIGRRGLRKVIASYGQRPVPGVPVYDLDDFVKALGALFKLQEREAKLLGLDRVSTPFDELTMMSDEEMAALLEEWQQLDAADGQ